MARRKRQNRRRQSAKAGLPPGSLVHIGPEREGPVLIDLMEYSDKAFHESSVTDISALGRCMESGLVSWVNVIGIHDPTIIASIAEQFGIHPLIQEDILNTDHRPKAELLPQQVFFTLKMMSLTAEGELDAEQVSIVLGPHYVISFQEKPGDLFDPVRNRLRTFTGIVRTMGADFLVYRLADCVVDSYFAIIEHLEERMEVLEDTIAEDVETDRMNEIQQLKRDVLRMRRALLPLREAVGSLEKGVTPLVSEGCRKYFHDVHDHLIQLADSLEADREVLSGITDLHMAGMTTRMNNVMKLLTVISTIFIPLTFIVGIYGMNFTHMPELEWHYGYFIALGVMAGLAGWMLWLFKRRGWI